MQQKSQQLGNRKKNCELFVQFSHAIPLVYPNNFCITHIRYVPQQFQIDVSHQNALLTNYSDRTYVQCTLNIMFGNS